METQELRELILKELPTLVQNDPAFREAVLEISRTRFADKTETESRFDHMMALLERKMEEDRQKWEKNQHQWEENQKQILALSNAIQQTEQRLDRKMEEDRQKWEEHRRQWEEKWEKNERRWEENQQALAEISGAIKKLGNKYDQTVGALGARWGMRSEASFRNALAGILSEFEGVEVVHVNEWDEDGVVFGRPEQIELDLIIRNGLLMIAELKSSLSKSELYMFEKKVRFYEQKYNRQATRMMVISPMVDPNVQPAAQKLGIEVYSYAEQVEWS